MSIGSSSLQKTVLEFKSTNLTVLSLLLTDNDLASIAQNLKEKVAQAPEFFRHSPIVIDFQKLTALDLSISVKEIVEIVRKHGFLPIGIRGGNQQQIAESLALNLPVHSAYGQNSDLVAKTAEKKPLINEQVTTVLTNHSVENKLINHPVRSGQRIYAKGDLIITALVSPGAEIMAEGNIHIYGSLRGRALAGVQGNADSRIFCSDLQAELISIAGIYQLSDDMDKSHLHKPVQISLESQKLIIKEI